MKYSYQISLMKKWIFPLLIIFMFMFFVVAKIHGSSIGMFHQYFYGATEKDPSLLFGKPMAIRSDEWVVTTPFVISQEINGFKEQNDLFQGGVNLGLLTDVPYHGWSAVFKPHLAAFFILPLENAFAFKWWFAFVMLLISAYFFVLKLFPDKVLFAALSSITFCFNPFIFWWFLNGTITPLYTGFLMLIVGMKLLDNVPVSLFGRSLGLAVSNLLLAGLFSYLLIVFALVIYPPFQIPIAIVVFFFLLGYLLTKSPPNLRKLYSLIWPFILASMLAISTILLFLAHSSSAIESISNTVYPGERDITSGGYDNDKLLTTYLQSQLQSDISASGYFNNPSEASNFIINSSILLGPSLLIAIFLYYKHKKVDWVLSSLIACNLLFLSNLYLSGANFVAKLFFLQIVPHERLVIGLGILGFITLLYSVHVVETRFANSRQLIKWLILIIGMHFLYSLYLGFVTANEFPVFVSNPIVILILCTWFYTGLLLTFIKKLSLLGIGLLACLSFFSSLWINPLYTGLSVLENNKIVSAIQRNSSASDSWGVVDSIYIENLPQVSGRKSISGTFVYPDVSYYKKIYPESDASIYNRYAHVFVSTTTKDDLTLLQPDVVAISLDDCNDKVVGIVTRLLSTKPLALPCFQEIEQIKYPNATFFIYRNAP